MSIYRRLFLPHKNDPAYPDTSAALVDLAARIEALETRQRVLVDTAAAMRSTMTAWELEMSNINVSLPHTLHKSKYFG